MDLTPVVPSPPAALGWPCSPLPEFLEEYAVGEALAADADSLQDPVAAELVQHQPGLQLPSLQGEGGVSGGHRGQRQDCDKCLTTAYPQPLTGGF